MTPQHEAEITALLNETMELICQGRDIEAVERLKRVQALIRVTPH